MNQTNPIRTFRLGALSPLLDSRAKHEKVKASVVMRRALREYTGKGTPAASSISQQSAPLHHGFGRRPARAESGLKRA